MPSGPQLSDFTHLVNGVVISARDILDHDQHQVVLLIGVHYYRWDFWSAQLLERRNAALAAREVEPELVSAVGVPANDDGAFESYFTNTFDDLLVNAPIPWARIQNIDLRDRYHLNRNGF